MSTVCLVIVNTNFNVDKELLIGTSQGAYPRAKLDILVLEDCMLFKEERLL